MAVREVRVGVAVAGFRTTSLVLVTTLRDAAAFGRGDAAEGGLLPLQVSFQGALQVVSAFASLLWTAEVAEIAEIMRRLPLALRSHRIGQQANRCEPRRRKRRPKHSPVAQ
jgi:hypothetical protein